MLKNIPCHKVYSFISCILMPVSLTDMMTLLMEALALILMHSSRQADRTIQEPLTILTTGFIFLTCNLPWISMIILQLWWKCRHSHACHSEEQLLCNTPSVGSDSHSGQEAAGRTEAVCARNGFFVNLDAVRNGARLLSTGATNMWALWFYLLNFNKGTNIT